MKRIVRTRIRVISNIAKEKEDPTLVRIYLRASATAAITGPLPSSPCPFLKAELKSFSTGVQRPPIPSPVRKRKGKKRRKKASHSRKRHEVTTTTTFGEYWCQPKAGRRRNSSRLPASQGNPPPFCSHVRRDASRPISTVCNFFALRPRILLTFRTGERYWGADRWGSNEIGLISMLNFQ